MPGTNIKIEAEVKMLTPEGIYLVVEDKGYFASFKDFPYLASLSASELFNIEYCGHGHIRWDEADIDLNTKILANPENYPIIMHPVKTAAAQMGKKGGAVRSSRKAAASRANGLKGGRPRKKEIAELS